MRSLKEAMACRTLAKMAKDEKRKTRKENADIKAVLDASVPTDPVTIGGDDGIPDAVNAKWVGLLGAGADITSYETWNQIYEFNRMKSSRHPTRHVKTEFILDADKQHIGTIDIYPNKKYLEKCPEVMSEVNFLDKSDKFRLVVLNLNENSPGTPAYSTDKNEKGDKVQKALKSAFKKAKTYGGYHPPIQLHMTGDYFGEAATRVARAVALVDPAEKKLLREYRNETKLSFGQKGSGLPMEEAQAEYDDPGTSVAKRNSLEPILAEGPVLVKVKSSFKQKIGNFFHRPKSGEDAAVSGGAATYGIVKVGQYAAEIVKHEETLRQIGMPINVLRDMLAATPAGETEIIAGLNAAIATSEAATAGIAAATVGKIIAGAATGVGYAIAAEEVVRFAAGRVQVKQTKETIKHQWDITKAARAMRPMFGAAYNPAARNWEGGTFDPAGNDTHADINVKAKMAPKPIYSTFSPSAAGKYSLV